MLAVMLSLMMLQASPAIEDMSAEEVMERAATLQREMMEGQPTPAQREELRRLMVRMSELGLGPGTGTEANATTQDRARQRVPVPRPRPQGQVSPDAVSPESAPGELDQMPRLRVEPESQDEGSDVAAQTVPSEDLTTQEQPASEAANPSTPDPSTAENESEPALALPAETPMDAVGERIADALPQRFNGLVCGLEPDRYVNYSKATRNWPENRRVLGQRFSRLCGSRNADHVVFYVYTGDLAQASVQAKNDLKAGRRDFPGADMMSLCGADAVVSRDKANITVYPSERVLVYTFAFVNGEQPLGLQQQMLERVACDRLAALEF